MTDNEANALAIKYPHISAVVNAVYAGRNDAHAGIARNNQFVAKELRDGYDRGYRQIVAEDRLNLCTEWDD